MKNYVSLERFSKTIGDVNLNKKVFLSLGRHAIESAKNVIKVTNKEGIRLLDDVTITLKNNLVKYQFDAEIDEGVDEDMARNSIKDIVTTNLLMLCGDAINFDIETRIKRVRAEE